VPATVRNSSGILNLVFTLGLEDLFELLSELRRLLEAGESTLWILFIERNPFVPMNKRKRLDSVNLRLSALSSSSGFLM
jgi:hypothetical protein